MNLEPISLYDYQKIAVAKIIELGGVALLAMEMGTGKTRVALEFARRAKLQRILIVVPLSAVGVWRREIANVLHSDLFVDCTRGSVKNRAQTLRSAAERDETTFAVVGYESYWRDTLRSAILDYRPELLILDEVHRVKGRKTKMAKFAHTLAAHVKYRLGLSGTPAPNGLEDLFSVFKAINPSVFGSRYFDFESMYVIRGGYGNYQIIGYKNEENAQRLVDKHSYRITKDEALILPEQIDVEIPVRLSVKEHKAYENLRKKAYTEVFGQDNTGNPSEGIAVSRVVITNILRLQQVTSGFVKVTDGREIELGTSKIDALTDLLEDAVPQAGRVVVFARFRHDIDAIRAACERTLKDVPCYVLDGRVKGEARDELLSKFWRTKKCVLVGQIQVSSLGIDLSSAHVAVFYSPDYSYTNYAQSRDRLHRIGQHHPVTYYHLVAEKSVDEKIYRALQKKQDLSYMLLDARRMHNLFV